MKNVKSLSTEPGKLLFLITLATLFLCLNHALLYGETGNNNSTSTKVFGYVYSIEYDKRQIVSDARVMLLDKEMQTDAYGKFEALFNLSEIETGDLQITQNGYENFTQSINWDKTSEDQIDLGAITLIKEGSNQKLYTLRVMDDHSPPQIVKGVKITYLANDEEKEEIITNDMGTAYVVVDNSITTLNIKIEDTGYDIYNDPISLNPNSPLYDIKLIKKNESFLLLHNIKNYITELKINNEAIEKPITSSILLDIGNHPFEVILKNIDEPIKGNIEIKDKFININLSDLIEDALNEKMNILQTTINLDLGTAKKKRTNATWLYRITGASLGLYGCYNFYEAYTLNTLWYNGGMNGENAQAQAKLISGILSVFSGVLLFSGNQFFADLSEAETQKKQKQLQAMSWYSKLFH